MFLLFNFQEMSWSCVPLGRNCDLGPEISVCFLSCFVWRKQEEVGLIGAVLACHSPSLAMNFIPGTWWITLKRPVLLADWVAFSMRTTRE